jgi:lipopolysaccharide biosynthesis protein
MLEQLVPADPATLGSLLDVLRLADTGLVGPRGTYFPLSTYWANNAVTVRRLVARHVAEQRLTALDEPERLGFFAGTMFWARLDAIAPLLDQPTRSFVREPTPKDGTLAHALERAFCVLPELLGRRLFDCDGLVVEPRAATAEPVPDWYRESVRQAWLRERAKDE